MHTVGSAGLAMRALLGMLVAICIGHGLCPHALCNLLVWNSSIITTLQRDVSRAVSF